MAFVWTQPLRVNQAIAGFQIATDLIPTSTGGFEIDWSTEGSVPGAAAYTPSSRLFDAHGVPVSDQVDGGVVTGAYSAPIQLHDTIQLADGTILKALQVGGATLPATNLVLQLFDQAGAPLGAPIFTTFLGGGGRAGLAQLPDGDIVLVYQELGTGGPGEIYATVLHDTAGEPPDTAAPVATDFFPAPGSDTLPPDWKIGITFSEAVKAGTGVITLETADGQVVDTIAAFNNFIQYLGSSMVIDPPTDLQPGTTYKLIVPAGAVTDLAGNPYAGESDYVFTTAGGTPAPGGDTTAPTVVDLFPPPGSTTLPTDWNLGITFSEAVKAGTGSITLQTAAGQVVQTFAPGDPGLQFVGSSLVVNPAADLQPGTTYRLVVAPGAVTDLAGNAWAGASDFTFTTVGGAPAHDTTAPTAVDFFPGAGSDTLPADWNFGITFSEAVQAGAGVVTLRTAAGQVVQTFAAGDPGLQFIGSSMVINPAADLQPGTTYQLIVAPGAVTDLAGNAYAGESDYSFTVALVGTPPA